MEDDSVISVANDEPAGVVSWCGSALLQFLQVGQAHRHTKRTLVSTYLHQTIIIIYPSACSNKDLHYRHLKEGRQLTNLTPCFPPLSFHTITACTSSLAMYCT